MKNSLKYLKSLNPRVVLANVLVVALLCLWAVTIRVGQQKKLTGVSVDIKTVEGVRDMIIKKEVYKMIQQATPYKISKTPISKLDIAKIEKEIKEDTRVHDAQVYVDAQRVLSVEIEQRRPLLRVKDVAGSDYYIDIAGQYVARSVYRAVRVPVVTGHLDKYNNDWSERADSKVKMAYQIGTAMNKDPFLTALIEQIHFEKSGRILLIPKVGKAKIVITDLEELDHKLSNLKVFYKKMAEKNMWNDFEEIDISYRNQVVPSNSVKP